MNLSEELTERGFIYQCSAPTVAEVLDGPPRTIYHGIDPSGDSAHVGHFAIWLLLRRLAAAGHRVIFLVGGGTGMIGDPKPDAERELKDEAAVDANVSKLKAQAEWLVGQGNDITFVNNKTWLGPLSLISFLRDIGKHFTVNELIKKDAIAKRLTGDTGISYTEFAYPLLQGYDYYVLNRDYGCEVQIGGSDQWGNIVAGVELVRRKAQKTVFALTVPLVIDKATGKKFGKSEGNAVWLDPAKTSPYEFYQFWLNVADVNVVDYLKLFTFLSLDEIAAVAAKQAADPAARQAQRALALAVTTLVHGEGAAEAAVAVSEVLFGGRAVASLAEAARAVLMQHAPTCQVAPGATLLEVVVQSGLATSNREARTFIGEGAVTLDGVKVTDEGLVVTVGEMAALRRGKKQFVVLLPS